MAPVEQHAPEGHGQHDAALPDGLMTAVVHERYGSAEVLHPAQVSPPQVGEHDVLVRVHAAGLDRGTWHFMTGRPYLLRLASGLRTPRQPVPGTDVAGTVVAVGAAVTGFAAGEEVYGFARGAMAQYAAVAEDRLARKPANLSFDQAAVVPVSATTALQGLCEVGRLEAGQTVLITGASGGVGSYAVQLAKAYGAQVTGVASTAKLDHVRSLGADHVIDRTREDFADGSQHYDLILDIAGNPSIARLRRALTPTGTAVIVGGEEGGPLTGGIDRQLRALILSRFTDQRLTNFIAKGRAVDLERLTGLIEAGEVVPSIDRTYPLEQAREAMGHLESGTVRGKIALTV
jgi:NADPH:quinone reductase-like Zn-dependent oxidoreductase